jgi:primosomal protein N'
MDNAFSPGDPALEVAGVEYGKHHYHHDEHWVVRDEQEKLNSIIQGKSGGHYYLIIGEKGTGKTSMLLEAMRKTNGDGVAMFEAHGDLEIFRIRLGKALDFEFHEEYVSAATLCSEQPLTEFLQLHRKSVQYQRPARHHCPA